MPSKIILHVPHTSIKIPLKDGYILDANTLEKNWSN